MDRVSSNLKAETECEIKVPLQFCQEQSDILAAVQDRKPLTFVASRLFWTISQLQLKKPPQDPTASVPGQT